jgi:uncharacterized protein (TIGR03032 family)
MTRIRPGRNADALWDRHHREFRDPLHVAAQWQAPSTADPRLLSYTVRGAWWDAVARAGQTLVVTREYEHLVFTLAVVAGRPRVSWLRLPHPSGIAVDVRRKRLAIASTRNPNMVFEFGACEGVVEREPHGPPDAPDASLLPVRCRYLPGCLYLHDLAWIGGGLFANAVSMNAVVELPDAGGFTPVWWPRCIDGTRSPRFERNYLQLNSIAAAEDLRGSYFSASAAFPSSRRPGDRHFPVDRRGVIFSGETRDVVAAGLTRPHSARLRGRELWVDNSGYGEFGRVRDGRFECVARLPGWTRGLAFAGPIAFVGTSRVIPRYRHYAPGVDCETSRNGIHAVDLRTGCVLGSLVWPFGNQIYAIEMTGPIRTPGFPLARPRRPSSRPLEDLFFRGFAGIG